MKPRLFLFLIFFAACGSEGAGAGEVDAGEVDAGEVDAGDSRADAEPGATDRYYEHALYDDPADCPDDPLFNCTPSLELCADGSARMRVTDIQNGGTWIESDGVIETEWGPGDVPESIEFTETGEEGALVDDNWDWEWLPAETDFSSC